jgi:hypothetical protein
LFENAETLRTKKNPERDGCNLYVLGVGDA